MKLANRLLTAMVLMAAVLGLVVLLPKPVQAQGTQADYQRAQDLQTRFRGLVVNVPGTANWIGSTSHFWYSKSVKGGTEFVLVYAEAATKMPAFDHAKLAAAFNAASGGKSTALTLPFVPAAGGRGGAANALAILAPGAAGPNTTLTFVDEEKAIEFGAAGFMWKCTLTDYVCTKGAALPQGTTGGRGGRGGPGGASEGGSLAAPTEMGGDPADGPRVRRAAATGRRPRRRFRPGPERVRPAPPEPDAGTRPGPWWCGWRWPGRCRPGASRTPGVRLFRRQMGGNHPELQCVPAAGGLE